MKHADHSVNIKAAKYALKHYDLGKKREETRLLLFITQNTLCIENMYIFIVIQVLTMNHSRGLGELHLQDPQF